MISLNQVGYRYPGNDCPVFNDLDLVIKEGEFVAVLGRNGSGKSTLASLLNGILIPDSGNVEVDGFDTRNVENQLEIRRRVGLLLPNPDNQLFTSQVEEDIAFGPENLGLKREEILARVGNALKMVSMEEFVKHPPYLLSGGEKQRVALAGVLALGPRYLVLDEPTTMLDSRGQQDVTRALLSLHRTRGTALVWITHDIQEVKNADRFIILDRGQSREYNSLAEIAASPKVLISLGIEPLEITQLIAAINREGMTQIDQAITEVQELVRELCRLK